MKWMNFPLGRLLLALSLLIAAGSGSAHSFAWYVESPTSPFPTINNLSWVWPIEGDEDLNSRVSVRFRRADCDISICPWRNAMDGRRVPAGSNAGFSWKLRHAGSIVDLEPGTRYQIELSLWDYDDWGNEYLLAQHPPIDARTRAEPQPPQHPRLISVTPATFSSVASKAKPGDVLELAPGNYSGFTFGASGTEDAPIVIRSGSDGTAVINGNVNLNGLSYVHLEALKIYGRVRFNNSRHLSITRNTVIINSSSSLDGIASRLRSENAYIADNTVLGPVQWKDGSIGKNSNFFGEGIVVTGPGHVITHNRCSGFHDCISLMEASEAKDQYSIDIVHNDIHVTGDDAIEADYCFHNCRVMRNSIRNAFVGMSSQPTLGGPNYYIRNLMYNVLLTPFKLHNGSQGDVILHNTVVKSGDALGIYTSVPFGHALLRNNLFIGGPGGTYGGYYNGRGDVLYLQALDPLTVDLNHDAFGSTTGLFAGRVGDVRFSSLQQLRTRTTETQAIEAHLDSLEATGYPSSPMTEYPMQDMRLRTGSLPQDRAQIIANINDGAADGHPDIGAYEAGEALLVYGPRSLTSSSESTAHPGSRRRSNR